jgi:hypothetical protein
MKSLYEIDQELQDVLAEAEKQAAENEGEISLILSVLLKDLHQEREQKIGNISRLYKSLMAEAAMVESEYKVLKQRADSAYNNAESLKLYLAQYMQKGELYTDPTVKISWRKSASVNVFDPGLLTDEFTKVKIEPDKTKIKEAIKVGKEVAGAVIVENNNIQIK